MDELDDETIRWAFRLAANWIDERVQPPYEGIEARIVQWADTHPSDNAVTPV